MNVYIATLPRSGSTLLGMMLGAHKDVTHMGESAYWSMIDASASRCCCGTVGCEVLSSIQRKLSCFPDEILSIHQACGIIDVLAEPGKVRHSLSLSAEQPSLPMLEQVLKRCCLGLEVISSVTQEVFGTRVIVENSKYLTIAERLLSRGDWKVLLLTRDPRGISFSNKKAGERKGVPRPVKDKMGILLSFARQATEMALQENVLLVRYEDLCKDVAGELLRICDFIDIRFNPAMLEFKRNNGHLLMGNHMMYDFNQKIRQDIAWKDGLTQQEKDLFTQKDLVEAYERLGYTL